MRRIPLIVMCLVIVVVAIAAYTLRVGEQEHQAGLLALRHGDYEAAFKQLESYLAEEPDDDATRKTLADAYVQQQLFAKAVDHYGLLSESSAGDLSLRGKLAAAALSAGRDGLAEEILKDLLESLPEDFGVNLALGELYHKTGRPADAIPFIRTCIVQQPERAQSYLLLSDALDAANRDQEMIAPLERCVSLDPDNAVAHANLAHAYQAAGHSTEAIVEAQWCLQRNPDLTSVRLILAKAQRDSGEFDSALQNAEQILAEEPSNLEAALLSAELLFFQGNGESVFDRLIGYYDAHKNSRPLINQLMRAAAARRDREAMEKFRTELERLLAE